MGPILRLMTALDLSTSIRKLKIILPYLNDLKHNLLPIYYSEHNAPYRMKCAFMDGVLDDNC